MSNDTVIQIENLSKLYRLGVVSTGTISHDLNRMWAKIRGKEDPFLKVGETNDKTTKGNSDLIWALKDISLEVKRGECLGIIGRNGAGKSTLLKILSKVTGPSRGCIKLKGRIGSLLEVGTGFHQEMTGRENIYMNGTILGMTHKDVTKKLDEIIDFAGVERYIDTPVKRYSSGMMIRLGFAVAAYLEPDILVVDEVLAVGDIEFQKKCLGKMGEVAKGGRTVLFVSHNMAAVQQLCTKGVLLKSGQVEYSGKIQDVINCYTSSVSCRPVADLAGAERHAIYTQSFSKIVSCEILNDAKMPCNDFFMGDDIVFKICVEIVRPMKRIEVGIGIRSSMNVAIHYLSSSWAGHLYDLPRGRHSFQVKMPKIRLFPGQFVINCYVMHDSKRNCSDDCVFDVDNFRVHEKDITNNFAALELNNTFAHYASSGSEVFVESEWEYLETKNE